MSRTLNNSLFSYLSYLCKCYSKQKQAHIVRFSFTWIHPQYCISIYHISNCSVRKSSPHYVYSVTNIQRLICRIFVEIINEYCQKYQGRHEFNGLLSMIQSGGAWRRNCQGLSSPLSIPKWSVCPGPIFLFQIKCSEYPMIKLSY